MNIHADQVEQFDAHTAARLRRMAAVMCLICGSHRLSLVGNYGFVCNDCGQQIDED